MVSWRATPLRVSCHAAAAARFACQPLNARDDTAERYELIKRIRFSRAHGAPRVVKKFQDISASRPSATLFRTA